jgi:hypothetical protein
LTSRALHWLTAILVLVMLPAGLAMGELGRGPLQDLLFHLHTSIGVLLIPIVAVRLLYRLTHVSVAVAARDLGDPPPRRRVAPFEPLCVVNSPTDRGLDRSVSSRRAYHGALDVRAASHLAIRQVALR